VRPCGVAGVSQRRGRLFGFSPGCVLVEPVFLFHKFLEEWAASVFGTMFPEFAQAHVGMNSGSNLMVHSHEQC
jgi:hypothetical protein